MKKLLFLLPFLLSFSAWSQTNVYHPFPASSDNPVWREHYTYNNGFCLREDDYQYFINGDTALNGQTYYKVYRTDSSTYWGCFDSVVLEYHYNELKFLIREDASKHIYFSWPSFTSEDLLYDFNLNIGDTIHSTVGSGNIVTSIDSVFIGSNYRKVYELYNYSWGPYTDSLFIIEGIGGSNGLFTHIEPFFESGGRLYCYRENNIPLWADSSFPGCNLVLTDAGEINDGNRFSFSISPNPFHSYATIHLNNNGSKTTLKIYNTLGSLVKQQTISGQSAIINREGLENGIYFIRVSSDEGEWVGKIVVE